MRVVLDTNVLISAILFSGPPSRILNAWVDEKFDLIVSTEILQEYREVQIGSVQSSPAWNSALCSIASRCTRYSSCP